VRGANISRAKDSVAPGISSRHKIPDDDVSSFGSDSWAVLQEHPGRSDSVNCSHDFAVQAAALAGDSEPVWVAGADVGARESSANRIDANQLSREVHGSHVGIDDPESGELPAEDGACIGIPFNGDDWLMAEDKVCEDAAAGTRK